MPTQDPVVQAGICLYGYVLNPAVRGELNRVLAAAKASPDDGSTILQNFFDRRQYATTPAAFKQVFSDYAKNPITLSPQATRFAIDFAANSVLRLDWYDAARQMAAAQSATSSAAAPAAVEPDPLSPFNDVLKRNGYTDVTPLQATLATTQLLTNGIGAWTGIYSQTTIVDRQGKSGVGPPLTIDSSKDPVQVRLDKKGIFGYKFDPDTNTLSWTKEGTGTFQNDSAAELNFSQYKGASSFTGTFDNGDGSSSYQGSTDPNGVPADNRVQALAAAAQPEELGPGEWIGIAGAIVTFLGSVAGAIGAVFAWKAFGAARQSPSQADMVNNAIRDLQETIRNSNRLSQATARDCAKLIAKSNIVVLVESMQGKSAPEQIEVLEEANNIVDEFVGEINKRLANEAQEIGDALVNE
jgi:hypothetical protein